MVSIGRSTMPKVFHNFIDSKWVEPLSGKTFNNINPAKKDEILGVFPRSDARDVDLAVQAAKKAFKEWSSITPPARGKILFEAGKIIAERKTELAKTLMREVGKTMNEALGEAKAAVDMCYFMAGEGRRLYGETTYSELLNRFAMTKRYPVGVCGIITPWNFPLSLISWKVCPALICGNTVVLKPAEDTPETANNFVEIMREAGLPGGVLNLVHGFGEEAGEPLVRHKDVDLISFTGSTEVGKRIATICGERLAKVSLELGGKNAVIVMEDCDLDLAINSIVRGAFSVAGERCTATSRAIVHKDIYDKFIEKLTAETKKLKVGPGDDESTSVCPVINETQLNKIVRYVEIGRKEGAKLILGGDRLTQGIHSKGFYFEPTIFVDVKPHMTIAREEIFGPVLAVFKVNSFEEAIEVHNATEYGLSASIFTRDLNRAMQAIDGMEAGVCYVNAPTFGSEVHLPFGGIKKSGSGHREVGKAALDIFSEWKTIYVDYSGGVQNVQFQKE